MVALSRMLSNPAEREHAEPGAWKYGGAQRIYRCKGKDWYY